MSLRASFAKQPSVFINERLFQNLPISGVEIGKERVEEVPGGDGGGESLWVEAMVYMQSAESLAQKGYKINLQKKFLARGHLSWEL